MFFHWASDSVAGMLCILEEKWRGTAGKTAVWAYCQFSNMAGFKKSETTMILGQVLRMTMTVLLSLAVPSEAPAESLRCAF